MLEIEYNYVEVVVFKISCKSNIGMDFICRGEKGVVEDILYDLVEL